MLIDANILVFAFNRASPFHQPATRWLTDILESGRRVAMPTQSLTAFVRLVTNARVVPRPAAPALAAQIVRDWLAVPTVWIPPPGPAHGKLFCSLVERYHLTGNLVSDASLAALALEHGLPLVSADTDFARFTELTWVNPLRGG
jgi:uncharacterized protein